MASGVVTAVRLTACPRVIMLDKSCAIVFAADRQASGVHMGRVGATS